MGYTRESILRYWRESFPVPNNRFIFSQVTRETDYPKAIVVDGATLVNSVTTLPAASPPLRHAPRPGKLPLSRRRSFRQSGKETVSARSSYDRRDVEANFHVNNG